MSSTKALLAVAVVALAGCDVVTVGYDLGFYCGHVAVDVIADDHDEVDDDAVSRHAWEDACASHAAVPNDIHDASDAVCAGRSSDLDSFVACDDPGDDDDALPRDCVSFGDCPDGVDGSCLCCNRSFFGCAVLDDDCDVDEDCCSGLCDAGRCVDG